MNAVRVSLLDYMLSDNSIAHTVLVADAESRESIEFDAIDESHAAAFRAELLKLIEKHTTVAVN